MSTKLFLGLLLVCTTLVAPFGASAHRPADRCGIMSVTSPSVPPDVLINNPAGPGAFDHGPQRLVGIPRQNTFGEQHVRPESICPPLGQP
jgi:hypothetical protein